MAELTTAFSLAIQTGNIAFFLAKLSDQGVTVRHNHRLLFFRTIHTVFFCEGEEKSTRSCR